jgi:hypothetical protein
MIDFEQLLDKAVGGDDGAGRTIPGAAMIAANKEGLSLGSAPSRSVLGLADSNQVA